MSLVTIAEAKEHLRVDFDDDDMLIQLYLDAAEVATANYLERELNEFLTGGESAVMNPVIKVAILLQTGHLYRNREAVTDKPTTELAMGVKWAIDPLRQGMGV